MSAKNVPSSSPDQKRGWGRVVRPNNKDWEARLNKASMWEARVAGRLAREGFYVVHSPILTKDDWDFDTPDLQVFKGGAGLARGLSLGGVAVEVKGVAVPWAETFTVCSEASYRRKYGAINTLPVPYVFASDSRVEVLLPGADTWLGELQQDHARGQYYKAVKARSSQLQPWSALVSYLKDRLNQT